MSIYDVDFVPLAARRARIPWARGSPTIDHLTHNVHRGRMDEWANFYERLFNFREVRYFDIEGKLTGLKSQGDDLALRQDPHPDQRERPTTGARSRSTWSTYRGEGIQHVALGTDDIHATSRRSPARAWPSRTRPTPTTSSWPRGSPATRRTPSGCAGTASCSTVRPAKDEMLLQIFTKTVIGPIFFEIIQRKGNQGFGEGNFRALFESIELDQIRRGC